MDIVQSLNNGFVPQTQHMLLTTRGPDIDISAVKSPVWRALLELLAQAKQDPHKLADYISALTRIGAENPRWVSTILRLNCIDLASLCCVSGKGLELAAAVIRQVFRVTVSDYEGEETQQGRTLECHAVACCLLRIYVRMKAYSLAEGILKAVHQYSLPSLTAVDWKTRCQFEFYVGIFSFYNGEYRQAADHLEASLRASVKTAKYRLTSVQFTKIMELYIPAQFIAFYRAPARALWEMVPQLAHYKTLISSCREGNYRQFNQTMKTNFEWFKRRRLVLAFESMSLRLKLNIMRRVWELSGRPKRLELDMYALGLRCAGYEEDRDAAEFYAAQLIHLGEVKGYIHHDLGLLLLSKTRPFPNTNRVLESEQLGV